MSLYLYALAISFVLTLTATAGVRLLALKSGLLEYPEESRKIHKIPTPLLGGVAIYSGFAVTVLLFLKSGFIADSKITVTQIGTILIGGLILCFGGFLDDKYDLKPKHQLLFPLSAAILILLSGIGINFISNPLGGIISFSKIISLPVTFAWIMGMMYTTKFLDGLDGLASGITAIGSLIVFFVSLSWDVSYSGTSFMSLILAGACLGFLVFNWHPAKIFLGEGGSVLTGYLLAVLSVLSGSKIATALLVLGLPILDVIWVILRRIFWEKGTPFRADRKHLHHRLLDLGFSQKQVVLIFYFFSLAFGISSLFLKTTGKIMALVILILCMLILAASTLITFKSKRNG
ncbi:undecaprenyl/decaprenyl-phosphate alpha-N-acetylglucosaminyl 1-phosphate transferase [Candidatus Parcubacteria bacterium]|nr:MAG: undecaprenyl/decaprenyl-phosphate alpha-N-acetylglucosaminyl 1-phosphate transferase [Candidatus Parcubacteria bacterium]